MKIKQKKLREITSRPTFFFSLRPSSFRLGGGERLRRGGDGEGDGLRRLGGVDDLSRRLGGVSDRLRHAGGDSDGLRRFGGDSDRLRRGGGVDGDLSRRLGGGVSDRLRRRGELGDLKYQRY